MYECKREDPQWRPCANVDPQWRSKDLCQLLSYQAVNHFRGDLQHMQVSQLTNQHPVVAVMGCQSPVCVMYSMCNFVGSQLAFLKIETNLYLQFDIVSLRNTVQFLNEIDRICGCCYKYTIASKTQCNEGFCRHSGSLIQLV